MKKIIRLEATRDVLIKLLLNVCIREAFWRSGWQKGIVVSGSVWKMCHLAPESSVCKLIIFTSVW